MRITKPRTSHECLMQSTDISDVFSIRCLYPINVTNMQNLESYALTKHFKESIVRKGYSWKKFDDYVAESQDACGSQLLTSFFLATRCRPDAELYFFLTSTRLFAVFRSSTGFRGRQIPFEVPRAPVRCGSMTESVRAVYPVGPSRSRTKRNAAFTGNSSREEGVHMLLQITYRTTRLAIQTFSSFAEYNVESIKRPPTHHVHMPRIYPD